MGNCQNFEDLAEDAKMLAYAIQLLLEEIDVISVRVSNFTFACYDYSCNQRSEFLAHTVCGLQAKHNLDKMKSC